MKNLSKLFFPIIIVVISLTGIYIYEQGKEKSIQVIERVEQAPVVKKKIVIHVDGSVRNPGVYQVTEDMHLYELLLLAEPLPEADLQKFNLAEILKDGKLIRVPSTKKKVKQTVTVQEEIINRINVNKASINDLTNIPGVGVSYAERIIAHREEKGYFNDIKDLLAVKGIGPAKLKKMEKYITLD